MTIIRRCILTFLFLIVSAMFSHAMDSMALMKNPLLGKTAPDFTLNTLEGEKNFTQFRDGKRAIIFFWATWCPHCREALEDLKKRKDDFAQKDIKLVLVDVGEKAEEVRSHFKEEGIQFNVFLDENSSVSDIYKIIGVPTFFFVNASRVIQDVQYEIPNNYEEILNKP